MNKTRRAEWLLLLLAAVAILGFHAKLKKGADPEQVRQLSDALRVPEEWESKVAPELELTLRDGTKFSLADHVGKEVVILNFFATWCGPCRAEAPELNRYSQVMRGKPVILIGIDAAEAPARVDAYVNEFRVPYPVGIDAGEIEAKYGVKSYPTTVVIGADGRIALYETGAIMNADVAFGEIVQVQIDQIRAGRGVARENYIALAKNERYVTVTERVEEKDEPRLTGRAAALANEMECLCGCSDKLATCSCSRATKMKEKLALITKNDQRSDAEIITALNNEFCVRGKKEM